MKFKGITIDEIGLEISEYKEEINGEEAYEYFCELLEGNLEGNAYLDEVDEDIILLRFERETNKETLNYVIDFYNKYIKNNKKILDNCNVKLAIYLDDFVNGEYNFEVIEIVDNKINLIDIAEEK